MVCHILTVVIKIQSSEKEHVTKTEILDSKCVQIINLPGTFTNKCYCSNMHYSLSSITLQVSGFHFVNEIG